MKRFFRVKQRVVRYKNLKRERSIKKYLSTKSREVFDFANQEIKSYPWMIASEGQAPAQEPQSIQAAASIL